MTDPQARRLGGLIKNYRDRHQLTLVQLEELSGIPDSWLFHLEKGHYSSPPPDRLAKLAEVLDIDAAEIDRLTSQRPPGRFLAGHSGLLPQQREAGPGSPRRTGQGRQADCAQARLR